MPWIHQKYKFWDEHSNANNAQRSNTAGRKDCCLYLQPGSVQDYTVTRTSLIFSLSWVFHMCKIQIRMCVSQGRFEKGMRFNYKGLIISLNLRFNVYVNSLFSLPCRCLILCSLLPCQSDLFLSLEWLKTSSVSIFNSAVVLIWNISKFLFSRMKVHAPPQAASPCGLSTLYKGSLAKNPGGQA